MSDLYKDLEQHKLYEIEQYKTQTQEEQIDQRKQREGLQEEGELTEQKALEQVRLRVSHNMPKTLREKIVNERAKIQRGNKAKGVISPEEQMAKHQMEILRNALSMPLAEDAKERELQAKHIGEGMVKARNACDAYLEKNSEPQTEEEKKVYEQIKTFRESLGDEGEGFSKDVDAILKKKKLTGVKNWMELLPDQSQDMIRGAAE
ncbi:MAG: hypothetical protein II754_03345 [Lachnospiraceae bacterium]|nr:hypothetical protein [Lachnospiraceae bacterium]